MSDQQAGDVRSVGERAPDFELLGTEDGQIRTYSLSEFTDGANWVVLTFYALDFNPICTAGMCSLQDAAFFDVYDDVVALGVSGDGVHSHAAFADRNEITYPLLADTGRDVADAYGVVQQRANGMRRLHRRSVFLVDPSRRIRFRAAIEADSPDDIDLTPVNEALKTHRG